MSNLRNPDLRARDIRKLVSYKSQSIVWDEGCNETSEWVMASLESADHRKKLLSWLKDKEIDNACEIILVDASWNEPKRLTWNLILAQLENYFGESEFQLYDLDLNWMLEYKIQKIARFGKFDEIK